MGQKTRPLREILTWLIITEKAVSMFHGEDRFFGQPKVQEAYNIINVFDGKQHPKISGSVDVKITPDFCS